MAATWVCPVCDYPLLDAPPEDGPVCPSCGTEFEIDDRYKTHDQLRRAWLGAGAPWFSSLDIPPMGWDEIRLRALARLPSDADQNEAPEPTIATWTITPDVRPLDTRLKPCYTTRLMSQSIVPKRWLCKASWRGTALRFYVMARNEEDALRKAENQVKRMQGMLTCMGVEILKEVKE